MARPPPTTSEQVRTAKRGAKRGGMGGIRVRETYLRGDRLLFSVSDTLLGGASGPGSTEVRRVPCLLVWFACSCGSLACAICPCSCGCLLVWPHVALLLWLCSYGLLVVHDPLCAQLHPYFLNIALGVSVNMYGRIAGLCVPYACPSRWGTPESLITLVRCQFAGKRGSSLFASVLCLS